MRARTRLLLDTKNAEGYTAAHYAAFKGNVSVLKCLQKYEATLGTVSDLGMSLLHFAAQGDKINTVLHLHGGGFDLNASDTKGSTPLHWAAYAGSEKVVEYLLAQPNLLLDQQDQDGHSPLHIAVAYGYSKIVRQLLVAGANRRLVNAQGQTALQIARSNEFEQISRMLDDHYSLLDYLKFACNAKARYEPRRRSYMQPLLFYCLAALLAFLSFGAVATEDAVVFWTQIAVYGTSIGLFTSLVLPPKLHEKVHDYGYYAERQEAGRLCMACVRPMQAR
jgi:palmitoyltransferase ZDHHC13/17